MPARCCVTECRSNYKGANEYVSVFKFPLDTELKNLWLRKIPRKNFSPSSRSVVCAKHFREEEIITHDDLPTKDGIIKIPRERPKLKVGAYPSIFPGCPSYLSEPVKKPSKISRDEKLKKIDEQVLKSFQDNDLIKSFTDFKDQLTSKITALKSNEIYVCYVKNKLHIMFIDFNMQPKITKSVIIFEDMHIEAYVGCQQINKELFDNVLEDGVLKYWSQMENIYSIVNGNSCEDLTSHYKQAVYHYEMFSEEDSSDVEKRKFLLEQLILSNEKKMARRYSSFIYHFAYSLYMKSTSCYKTLYEMNLLSIPSIASLSKIINLLNLNMSPVNVDNIKYIKSKCDLLEDNEKVVNLLLDEIHIKSQVTYKGNKIIGYAENRELEQANTSQSFMITSIFSSFKEVVALVPVHRMTSEDLHALTLQILELLDKAGFNVLCIISDNNRVNRKMFEKLNMGVLSTRIKNPVNESKLLFLMFDSVHLLKTIRNNWINQNDSEKSFQCPDFEDPEKIINPRFGLLRKMFNLEKDKNIKYAHQLTAKAMYPTNIEKQNVLQACKVFHESNPAALERLADQYPCSIFNWQDTAHFLKLIKKWWDIMNVSHPKKGIFSCNSDSKPFSSINDERFIFLQKFVNWLKVWKSLKQPPRCGCLSDETFVALIQTSSTIVEIAQYLLQNGAKYVLSAKFQTDALEFQFSLYRQMSGSNYHVSLQQLLESERKLRIKSVLNLHSKKYGEIPLNDFVTEVCSTGDIYNFDVSMFKESCDIDLNNFPLCDTEIITYISGYCVYKLKLLCEECKSFFHGNCNLSFEINTEMPQMSHTAYLDLINRGSMKIPSANIVYIVSACYAIFTKLVSTEFELLFMNENVKQHLVICKLTEMFLIENTPFDIEEKCIVCNKKIMANVMKIIATFANICLNNYTKAVANRCISINSDNRKIKKFKK